jgi:hypothetical protein
MAPDTPERFTSAASARGRTKHVSAGRPTARSQVVDCGVVYPRLRVGLRAFCCGELRQVGLSAKQVLRLCPESASPGWSVVGTTESVGEAAGVVHTWLSGQDHVHWDCPLCGRVHISDFEPHADSNPVLWFCEAGDGGLCLVNWQRKSPNPSLTYNNETGQSATAEDPK